MNEFSRVFSGEDASYFLFGPRGTGKTTWLKSSCTNAFVIDLLDARQRLSLMADPQRLRAIVEANRDYQTFVVDEIQKLPSLLDVVHQLMEMYPELRFVLTGSSARKLKRAGVDLLGGRALERHMHPFMACELGNGFSLDEALETGLVPVIGKYANRSKALASYLSLYIREEVEQAGLVRNLDSFARFLEAISFSHASVLSPTAISKDCAVKRTTVDSYVSILDDLLIGKRLGVFSKRAKRRLVSHEKFYFFDAGVYRAIRPHGPLDRPDEIDGAALEGLVFQHLLAWCEYSGLDNGLYYWRTQTGDEVDFVVYADSSFTAIEVKNAGKLNASDFKGLRLFGKDYPEARRILLYRGNEQYLDDGILVVPVEKYLRSLVPGRALPEAQWLSSAKDLA